MDAVDRATLVLLARTDARHPALRRRALLGALLAGTAVTAACSGPAAVDTASSEEAGYVSGDGTATEWTTQERADAIEISGTTMAGDPVDLADWRGQIVVLNFWYAACPPCRKEAPDLAAIAADYEAEGVQFLGINSVDEPETAQAFERRFDIPYPSLHDSDSQGIAATQGLVPLTAVPTTLVLDGEGRAAARIIGIADPAILRSMIDRILQESQAS